MDAVLLLHKPQANKWKLCASAVEDCAYYLALPCSRLRNNRTQQGLGAMNGEQIIVSYLIS